MKFFIGLLATLVLSNAAPAQATMLVGQIQYHDVEGRIGVRVNHSGRVFKVHPMSPAAVAGIQKGDVITSVDGRRSGIGGNIHGTPGTVAHITVKRIGEDQELSFEVPRIEFQHIQMLETAPLLVQK